jgi:hypothetical protein
VEGQRSEALFHGPLLARGLVWVQVRVGCMSRNIHTAIETLELSPNRNTRLTHYSDSIDYNVCKVY